ncbi:50S ribosomal protein L20 [Candidatus Peregrinibacteria bacterium]|nr:50S ribosomal protein L20 [Candidatus Peregrinibacteria bacterium]
MTRVKRGVETRRKHKKIFKATKGFRGLAQKTVKRAKQAAAKAGQNAYVGRKLRKRDMRSLWITRINAAVRAEDLSYSRFMYGLLKAKVAVDRKILADLAVNNPKVFKKFIETAKAEL